MYQNEHSSQPGPYSTSPPGRRMSIQDLSEGPFISYGLMTITIIIYLLQLGSQGLLGVDYPAALGMKVNPLIIRGELWRLFTPMLLHGSILHLGFNMYALYILGPGLERYYGHGRFLSLYVLSGFTGNVVSFLFSSSPSLGASTAIFGLLGAQGVFLYRNRGLFGAPAQRALINIVIIAAINLMIGTTGGIDNWGHVGGLIGGGVFAWFAGPLFRTEAGMYTTSLVDEHDSGDALRAGLIISASFALAAAAKIFLNMRVL